ncbi:MAG: hypothetical protein PHI68_06870 [Candidatus Cloacimonetes bacterium]|nr:hypothetical protein [Candidatus Cloacimonadota bacterium]
MCNNNYDPLWEKYCNVLNKVFKDSLTSQEWISKKNEKVKVSIQSGCVDFISDNLAHQAAKVLKIENLTLIESHPGISSDTTYESMFKDWFIKTKSTS